MKKEAALLLCGIVAVTESTLRLQRKNKAADKL